MPALWLALLFGFLNCGYGWDYGNGRHGSYVLTSSTTIEQLYQAVRLTNDPVQYNPADSNAIPNFQNLIITNGAILTVNAWNGSSGGRIVLKVEASLFVASGSGISANGIGYRGGSQSYSGYGSYYAGIQGESYTGNQTVSPNANYGGGGGGNSCGSSGGSPLSYGGGGGGYGGGGGGTIQGFCGYGANGGGAYGDGAIDTDFLGSGGGGTFSSGETGAGGNGGGSINLVVGNLQVSGFVQCNGAAGTSGGGGSGGSIVMRVSKAFLGTNTVTSTGGAGGGYNNNGGGGVGRIAIYYAEGFSGSTSPTAYALLDTNSDNVTVFTNQPAAQISSLGSNVVFSVGESGFSPFFYQWYFNNTAILGATNQTFLLANLAFTNQGNYSVAVSNVVGIVVSTNAYLTVLDPRDPWGDGIPNWWKSQYGLSLTDPTLATNDPTGDKLTYFEKYVYGLNPLTNDTDGDGLTDYDEIFDHHTNPLLASTSGDGIPDGWKVLYGMDPLIANANSVAGFDGVTYLQVYQYDLTHTNQLNPNNAFGGRPGSSNFEIINNGQHTNSYYYDHEDRLVGAEYSRGISIAYIYDGNGNLLRQTVLSRTAETNGLPVLWLWLNGLTNQPGIAYENSSGNSWDNYQEWLGGLNPNSNSIPSLLNNPGTNIASLSFPFTPSNCVVAAGQLNGMAGDEIVVGADGNATGKTNFLLVLTQGSSVWQNQRIPIGAFGVTSISVGQPTNRPAPAIYAGLRQKGGTGEICEFLQTNGAWQTNILAFSTNEAAYVLGARSQDVLVSISTNGLNGVLFSLAYSNGIWNQTVLSTNSSHLGLGTHGEVFAEHPKDSSLRLLDTGGVEIIGGTTELYSANALLPSGMIQDPGTGKWHFSTPTPMTFSSASNYFAGFHGKLSVPMSAAENGWFAAIYPALSWIGLYWAQDGGGNWHPYYGDGSPAPNPSGDQYGGYGNWIYSNNNSSGHENGNQPPSTQFNYEFVTQSYQQSCSGCWSVTSGTNLLTGIGEVPQVAFFTNQWILSEPPATSILPFRGISLAAGLVRPNQTNSSSIIYAFADDINLSGQLDTGDDFTLAEYVVSGNTWTTNTLFQVPITAANVAQSFSLAAIDFMGTGNDTLFTGEPDGRVYSWTGTNATSPLERQLFSDAYVGDAWQAMCSLQMPGFGSGLAGLQISPTNQNTCNVILWAPQAVLPTPQPSLIETAPYAAVIPSANPLGSNAVVTVRLWHDEGDASTPFLQFQILGTTNWQNATLTVLDGLPYSSSGRVAALPTGSDHSVTWNALADMGANVVTSILLRANARDFMLTGNWSLPTPFLLNTTIATSSSPTNSPVKFTGITQQPGGIVFNWQGGSNALLYLQHTPTLAGTNANWVNIWTGAPSVFNFGSYTDLFGTNHMGFYRLQIVSP